MNHKYLAEFSTADGYLNFASVGPPSRAALSAAEGVMEAVAEAGESVVGIITPAYERARATIARALGVPGARATSVPSTSAGIMQVAFGLLGAGGNLVVPAHEFPANLYPWLRAEAVGGPEVRAVEIPDRRVTAEALSPAIDGETRIVAFSLVDYMSGFRADVEEIAGAAGDALVLVDGIQGLGAVAAELGPADVFVAGGQKWLRAGLSGGVMAVSERALERLAPTLTGWFGVEDNFAFEVPPPHGALPTAERFLESSPNVLGAVTSAAALEVVEIAGIEHVEAAVLERSGAVLEIARGLGAEVIAPWRSDRERAGIVTLRLAGVDAASAVTRLGEGGIVVSERNGWIRVSPHATTPLSAIERLGEALAAQPRNA